MSRFDYVKYDGLSVAIQSNIKKKFEELENHINGSLNDGRAKDNAIIKLEEAYMWVGKAVRDEQISDGRSAESQEERKDS